MFIEPFLSKRKTGWLEVICGCMFSGKTEELIRRLKRAEIAGQKTEIFKPGKEIRYDPVDIVSHNFSRIRSTPVENHFHILILTSDADVVGIDGAHFFDEGLIEVAEDLIQNGKRVIIAGLDKNDQGNPFGPIPALLARAEYITKLHAICARCGENASYSYRKRDTNEQSEASEKELYEPRCRHCFYSL